jgi:hypothetical protein
MAWKSRAKVGFGILGLFVITTWLPGHELGAADTFIGHAFPANFWGFKDFKPVLAYSSLNAHIDWQSDDSAGGAKRLHLEADDLSVGARIVLVGTGLSQTYVGTVGNDGTVTLRPSGNSVSPRLPSLIKGAYRNNVFSAQETYGQTATPTACTYKDRPFLHPIEGTYRRDSFSWEITKLGGERYRAEGNYFTHHNGPDDEEDAILTVDDHRVGVLTSEISGQHYLLNFNDPSGLQVTKTGITSHDLPDPRMNAEGLGSFARDGIVWTLSHYTMETEGSQCSELPGEFDEFKDVDDPGSWHKIHILTVARIGSGRLMLANHRLDADPSPEDFEVVVPEFSSSLIVRCDTGAFSVDFLPDGSGAYLAFTQSTIASAGLIEFEPGYYYKKGRRPAALPLTSTQTYINWDGNADGASLTLEPLGGGRYGFQFKDGDCPGFAGTGTLQGTRLESDHTDVAVQDADDPCSVTIHMGFPAIDVEADENCNYPCSLGPVWCGIYRKK